MRLVYLIGQPGAGKSTLAAALTARLTPTPVAAGVPRVEWRDGERLALVSLGRLRNRFPGTDTLSMAIQPKAIAWLSGHPHPLVFGEGDRLATASFFDAMAEAGVDLRLVWLDTPDEVAAHRCRDRQSAQAPEWVAGRRTKVLRLVRSRPHTRLDGTLPPKVLVSELSACLGKDWP